MFWKLACSVLWGGLSLAAAEQTLTGVISDEMCGADHSAMAQEGQKVSPHDCSLVCVKNGSQFVIVSGGKVYAIANQDFSELTKHAGHHVTVTGNLASDGKTITLSKVQMNQ